MNSSQKKLIVYAIRDFPPGCGTSRSVSNVSSRFNPPQRPFKNPRTSDDDDDEVRVKVSRVLDHAAASSSRPKGSFLKQESKTRDYDKGHHVAPKPKGICFKQEPEIKSYYHGHTVGARKQKGSCSKQEPEMRNYAPHDLKQKGSCFKQETKSEDDDSKAREKVLEVLRVFDEVFTRLDRDKQARRGEDLFIATNRIDIKTQAVLEKMGKQVNTYKRIGHVPGIKVGDVFRYKTELRLVGLHFKTMCGIDYMKIGDVKLATCIVSSEGYGYDDKFDANVVVYTGEGGNVVSKEEKTEDQKMENGNLALANSMRQKKAVRVIRGEERLDRKGKRYVYLGLYLVEEYWPAPGARGKTVFKFKLCKIPGQPHLT